ncbi:MAG: putative endonuclease [Phenylobacterium sp.]|jgi:putative endonuclease
MSKAKPQQVQAPQASQQPPQPKKAAASTNSPWYVYILRCADNSLYTGITTDVLRREREHNGHQRVAAKYTRARQPVKMIYHETLSNRSCATRREMAIKKMQKKHKEILIQCKDGLCLFHA